MANFDFDELKRKATETAGVIVDKSAEMAKVVAEKAKILAKKAKLVAEIAGEKENLKKQYIEIGRIYYEKFADSPDESLEQSVMEAAGILERIDAKKTGLEALRSKEAEMDAEFECQCDGTEDCCCECEEKKEECCGGGECAEAEEEKNEDTPRE